MSAASSRKARRPALLAALALAAAGGMVGGMVGLAAAEAPPQVVPVQVLAKPPKVDGNLADWSNGGWTEVPIKPALAAADRPKYGLEPGDDRNATGELRLQLKAGVHGGRFYLALRYPDAEADTLHKPWELRGDKYGEGKQREDMLAVRFHLDGDFDRSMLSNKEYRADVWQWSAARTNPAGVAEDLVHRVTTRLTENAAEYTPPSGRTIYIVKQRDAGNAPYRMLPRPKENRGNRTPSFEPQTPSGSAADVAAKGEWKAGFWQLEFGRALDTGHDDDVVFRPKTKLLGQIAVFNKGYSEHKSVSEALLFDFSAVK